MKQMTEQAVAVKVSQEKQTFAEDVKSKQQWRKKMAKNRGWWDLELKGNRHDELSEGDRDHIARLIKEGYTGGEVVEDEEV